jgi:hypothetical protein
MSEGSRIDAAELSAVRLSSDGSCVILVLRDAAGQKISLSLPRRCLGSVLAAMPQVEAGSLHTVDTWNMAHADNGEMVLTLSTPEGLSVSFVIKAWQVEGMASVATYGGCRETERRMLH